MIEMSFQCAPTSADRRSSGLIQDIKTCTDRRLSESPSIDVLLSKASGNAKIAESASIDRTSPKADPSHASASSNRDPTLCDPLRSGDISDHFLERCCPQIALR